MASGIETSVVSPRLAPYFNDYAAYHKAPGNKATHTVGITLIVASLLGLLGQFTVAGGMTGFEYVRLDGGTILIFLGFLWYLYLDWKIALPFGLVAMGLYYLGRSMSIQVNGALFVIGWIFQAIGHAVYEKNSPAFAKNLLHLMTGPLWIFAKIVGYK